MAKFSKKHLGETSGKLGDFVFRKRYGKTYIASRPISYKTPHDEKSVKNRGKFQFMLKLSSAIGKIYLFKQIWKNSDIPGDIFHNKIYKANNNKVSNDFDISGILLIPMEEGFNVEVLSSELNEKNLTLTIAQPGENSGIMFNKRISAQGIVYLKNAKDKTDINYAFIPVVSEDIQAVVGNSLSFIINFTKVQQAAFNDYHEHSFVINLLVKNIQGEPQTVSVNICG